jgi:hypothetical protein
MMSGSGTPVLGRGGGWQVAGVRGGGLVLTVIAVCLDHGAGQGRTGPVQGGKSKPNAAVRVLGFPDFTARDAAIQQPEEGKGTHVQFRSGPHTLIARTIEGNYPNYRQVIPHEFLADATIPETHRPALISWLRSLAGKGGKDGNGGIGSHQNYVRLTWEKPGHLTLTLRGSDETDSHIHVPVGISGESRPPVIAFAPGYLAHALAIGPTLRLIDGLSPGMASSPSGNFCVLMPQRCAPEDAPEVDVKQAKAPAKAA